MKTITLTMNEALVLIAEGMTMNNVKTLANKLRNANAPQPAIHPSNAAYEKMRKDNEDLCKECVRHYEALEKAKNVENVLRAEISNLENDAKQDDESLKYFRNWVEGLRVATDADKGLGTSGVFSQAIEMIKESNRLGDRVVELESRLNKANDVIATVKAVYDDERKYNDVMVLDIEKVVEAYYRGN